MTCRSDDVQEAAAKVIKHEKAVARASLSRLDSDASAAACRSANVQELAAEVIKLLLIELAAKAIKREKAVAQVGC